MDGNKMSDAEWKLRAHCALNGLPQPQGPIYKEETPPDPDAKMKLWFKRGMIGVGAILFASLAYAQFHRDTANWKSIHEKPRFTTIQRGLQGAQ